MEETPNRVVLGFGTSPWYVHINEVKSVFKVRKYISEFGEMNVRNNREDGKVVKCWERDLET